NWNWPGRISVAGPSTVQLLEGKVRFVVASAVNGTLFRFVMLNWNAPLLIRLMLVNRGSGMSPEKVTFVSTRPEDPLFCPPVTRARPRTRPLAVRFTPVSPQPPVMREPVPSAVHVAPPSVDRSKATSCAAGEE